MHTVVANAPAAAVNSVCCSYLKISGDTCMGGDIESRLEGEMLPCPLAGECLSVASAHAAFVNWNYRELGTN